MAVLVTFFYVIPLTLTLGHYPTRQQCELDRMALLEKAVRDPKMRDMNLICLGPDMQVERKRFEFHSPEQ